MPCLGLSQRVLQDICGAVAQTGQRALLLAGDLPSLKLLYGLHVSGGVLAARCYLSLHLQGSSLNQTPFPLALQSQITYVLCRRRLGRARKIDCQAARGAGAADRARAARLAVPALRSGCAPRRRRCGAIFMLQSLSCVCASLAHGWLFPYCAAVVHQGGAGPAAASFPEWSASIHVLLHYLLQSFCHRKCTSSRHAP